MASASDDFLFFFSFFSFLSFFFVSLSAFLELSVTFNFGAEAFAAYPAFCPSGVSAPPALAAAAF
jgi:hypothetical protein